MASPPSSHAGVIYSNYPKRLNPGQLNLFKHEKDCQQALTDAEPQLFSLRADVVRVISTRWVMNTTWDSFGYLHWIQRQRHNDDVVCNLRQQAGQMKRVGTHATFLFVFFLQLLVVLREVQSGYPQRHPPGTSLCPLGLSTCWYRISCIKPSVFGQARHMVYERSEGGPLCKGKRETPSLRRNRGGGHHHMLSPPTVLSFQCFPGGSGLFLV